VLRHPIAFCGALAVVAVILSQCSSAQEGESTRTVRQGIIGGQTVSDPSSPVLFLVNVNEGLIECTATLIAPNLAVTARHCVAQLTMGMETCTPEGMLATGNGAGALGANYPPGDLQFYSNAQVLANTALLDMPTVVGSQIISTGAASICADDLAFVVLSQPVAGVQPAAVRLTEPTYAGEPVSVYGYGYTEVPMVTVPALRVRTDASIVAVGPTTPPSSETAAPLRALRVGPGEIACNGDSGGGIFSNVTGALIGVVSIGEAVDTSVSLSCSSGSLPDTTGPVLSNYASLAFQAFAAADASPILEDAGDASLSEAGPDASDAAAPGDAGAPGSEPTPAYDTATGGGCSAAAMRFGGRDERGPGLVFAAMAAAAAAAARRERLAARRRRHWAMVSGRRRR
jgi:hypothetical protein